jgi:hypothetical protein
MVAASPVRAAVVVLPPVEDDDSEELVSVDVVVLLEPPQAATPIASKRSRIARTPPRIIGFLIVDIPLSSFPTTGLLLRQKHPRHPV